ncbi:MAG: AMIN domain-containing protein [Gemmatimonadaceae bacterium]
MKRLWTDIPRMSGRMARALACGAGAVLLAAAALPVNDAKLISLSVEPTSGRAQVMIGINGTVSVRDFTLRNPDRIVIDLTGATLGVRRGGYDRIARGGVVDVRYAQNQPNVVRVVLTLDDARAYQVERSAAGVRVSVDGGGQFVAWRVGQHGPSVASEQSAAPAAAVAPGEGRPAPARPAPARPAVVRVSAVSAVEPTPSAYNPPTFQQPQQRQGGRPITVTWENANLADVLAGFAAHSGRTIIPASNIVTRTIDAEIINQPWDVAMRAILNANGLDVIEDASGILIVNTFEALAARPRLETLTTRTVRLNYASAQAVAQTISQRLSRDCGAALEPGAQPAPGSPTSVLQCPVRGAVSFDSLSNTVAITDVPSVIEDLTDYALSLDIRQPQVNIKAKIILVDRTQLEGLGLKYDIGTRFHHFSDIIPRIDSSGSSGGSIFTLGGNTVAAIANASQSVPSAALRIVYSAALGAYDFTTFLDALQETSLLDVQAEPSVTTLNHRQAVLSAGTQVPVRTIEQGAGAAAGVAPRVTVQFRQTGIVLRVTPSVTSNRQIRMVVHAENSSVQFQAGSDVGAVFPTQQINNELLVADGETAVMGGLTQTTVNLTRTGIPILVDLPLIGRLFGVTNRSETKRDLLILITPHIVDEGDMSMSPRRDP